MPRAKAFILTTALLLGGATLPAQAEDGAAFMQRFSGSWIGTGQLLFGPEPRSEFACELKGDPDQQTFGMTGQCRMGAFAAPIHAKIRYNDDTGRYYGQFMDGAQGNGVDLLGDRAGEGFSMRLMRDNIQGRLSAETDGTDRMKVVIYYRDPTSKSETPVVALGFTRKEVITGAVSGK